MNLIYKNSFIYYKATYQHAGVVKSFTEYLQTLGYDENYCNDTDNAAIDPDNIARVNRILNDARLLDASLIDNANKTHWLYAKLITYDNDIESITSSSLYKMLESYPAGTMLKDITGHFWARRT